MAALDRYGIEYLIVGGIAVGFHAEPRFTKDLDVLVAIDSSNYLRLYDALKEFGAPLQMVKPEEFLAAAFCTSTDSLGPMLLVRWDQVTRGWKPRLRLLCPVDR